MFAIGVIGISALSKGSGVHLDLKDMLFGNVLGVSDSDLFITSLVAVFVIGSVAVLYHRLFATTFQPVVAQTMGINVSRIHYFLMLVLSFSVVASLRTVGVILVVAMLVTPSATALLLAQRLQRVIVLSGVIGFLAAFVGINVAILVDTTPGPAIVVTATVFYILAVFFAPEKGVLARWLNRRKIRADIEAK
jgi:ABC-type Mn2+/Zn2+ transport system permease subunit